MGPDPLRMQQIHDTTGGGAMDPLPVKHFLTMTEDDTMDDREREIVPNYKMGRVDAELTIMADRLRDEAMAIEDAAEVMNG